MASVKSIVRSTRGRMLVRADASPNQKCFGDLSFNKVESPEPLVVLISRGRPFTQRWEQALALGRVLVAAAKKAESLGDDGRVMLFCDGALEAVAMPDGARQVATVLINLARRVEELVKHEEVALDAATLVRAGAGFSLGVDPRVVAEGNALALNDRDLRRFMAPRFSAAFVPQPPTIQQNRPTPAQAAAQAAYKRAKRERRERTSP